MNPSVGDFDKSWIMYNELIEELEGCDWIPAIIVSTNIKIIQGYLSENNFEKVMLILTNSANSDSDDFLQFVSNPSVEYIVTEENKMLRRKLRGYNKNFILLNDCFKKLDRNKDYLIAGEEKFTEENIFFAEDKYYGFSDYTTVSSEFIEGGTSPYAVVIHITYQKDGEAIWIKHFTSISNEDQANVQGKFAEVLE
jgi:hypothetical protein